MREHRLRLDRNSDESQINGWPVASQDSRNGFRRSRGRQTAKSIRMCTAYCALYLACSRWLVQALISLYDLITADVGDAMAVDTPADDSAVDTTVDHSMAEDSIWDPPEVKSPSRLSYSPGIMKLRTASFRFRATRQTRAFLILIRFVFGLRVSCD